LGGMVAAPREVVWACCKLELELPGIASLVSLRNVGEGFSSGISSNRGSKEASECASASIAGGGETPVGRSPERVAIVAFSLASISMPSDPGCFLSALSCPKGCSLELVYAGGSICA
jgi:hypothetical protein